MSEYRTGEAARKASRESKRRHRAALKARGASEVTIKLPPVVVSTLDRYCTATGSNRKEVVEEVMGMYMVQWAAFHEPTLPRLEARNVAAQEADHAVA